jgi:hypothetical protein
MSANEAAELIRTKEGKFCGRFYRRADGRMLTADCPVGLERYGRRLKALCSTAAALLLSSLGVSAWSNFVLRENDAPKGRFAQACDDAVWRVKGWLGLNPPPTVLVGMISVSSPLPPPSEDAAGEDSPATGVAPEAKNSTEWLRSEGPADRL